MTLEELIEFFHAPGRSTLSEEDRLDAIKYLEQSAFDLSELKRLYDGKQRALDQATDDLRVCHLNFRAVEDELTKAKFQIEMARYCLRVSP